MKDLNINIIKEQYERLTDSELKHLATEDSESLSVSSFQLLLDELERRGIENTIIEQAKVDRQLAEVTKLSGAQNAIANNFINIIWNQCLDLKESGKSDEEIHYFLVKQGFEPQYAYMLIASMETEMGRLSDNAHTENILGWVLMLIGGGLIVFALNFSSLSIFYLSGLVAIVSGVASLNKSARQKEKSLKVLEKIKRENELKDNMYQ